MVVTPIGQSSANAMSGALKMPITSGEQAPGEEAKESARQAARDRRNEARKESVESLPVKGGSEVRGIDLGSTYISFEVNKELGRVVTRVMDKTTGDVIREIPPKELQEVAVQLRKAAGRLLDEMI